VFAQVQDQSNIKFEDERERGGREREGGERERSKIQFEETK
jgi:hypothetical protein